MLFISLFYTVSCNSASVGNQENECSADNLIGTCSSGKTCLAGECVDNSDLCSEENGSGLCISGSVCLNGICIDKSEICSETNLLGKCETGKTCLNGECSDDNSDACSPENPNGKCLEEETCINGVCKSNVELCSADNLNGICLGDKICNSGVCVDKKCEDNQKRNCYPGSESQINKGICREGIQLCKNGEWNECVGAITPQEEVCDYLDNDCDGIVDEGVKNICGDCREEADLPTEIIGNNIDDDCDGKIDEDENNPDGDNCDGRMHQPCYTGPIGTGGVGICRGGFRDCKWDPNLAIWGNWGECIGMILPIAEICGNNIDDNCDGIIDENCQTRECLDEEICGNNIDDNCDDYIDENCSYDVVREECLDEEICNNGFDDNCDGNIDENCSCGELTELDCFASDPSMLNHGETSQCKKGIMYCVGGENWGNCQNQVLPSVEFCDGIDNDCDGIIDNNAIDGNLCGGCDGEVLVEICGNNIDDNCDGFVDENCPGSNCTNPTEEVCDGTDNDCDGFIDEGVLNSCGKCDDSCYEIIIGSDNTNTCIEGSDNYPNCLNNINDDFNDGQFDGVDIDENGNVTLNTQRIENNFIWIANSTSSSVTKINTITGESFGPFPIGINSNPSRTAVTRDGGVWVANRDTHDVYKLDSTGGLVEGFPVQLISGCTTRGVAIDKDGNGWVGCHGSGTGMSYIYKISPSGEILINGSEVGNTSPIYGLAIDSKGFLWNSTRGSSQVFRIDTSKNPGDDGFINYYNKPGDLYGIVIDHDDNIWYGNYGGNVATNIFKVTYDEINATTTNQTFPSGGAKGGRGLAIDNNNHIWCAFSGSNQLVEFDINGTSLRTYPSGGATPVGVGVDSEGDVWVINYTGGAREYKYDENNPNAEREYVQHDLLGGNYTYSDMTGYNLRNITAPSGTFVLVQDTKYADSTYDSLRIVGETPNNSKIKARVQISNDQNSWSEWSNSVEFINSNTNMPLVWQGNKPMGRYIKIEVTLILGDEGTKPIFSNIYVNWQRP
jgi:streptogramin lyase